MTTRIFIAEDQPLVRRGLEATVNAERGMKVCGEAGDCATALREVRRLRPDVVITELSLGNDNAIDLMKSIAAQNPSIRIVVLSHHDELVYALPTFRVGAKAYLMKHEPPGRVIEAIRKVRAGQMFFSDRVASQMLERISDGWGKERALSPRELQVVELIGSSHTTREIASRLKVSKKTVESHRAHIMEKAQLGNSTELARYSIRFTDNRALQLA